MPGGGNGGLTGFLVDVADEDKQTYSLNLALYHELSHIYDTSSTVKHCVGLLDRFLFQSVRVKRAKRILNSYLDEYFLPFFRRMLRNIVILGWCPYRIKKMKDPMSGFPILVPEVIPIEFIDTFLVVDTNKLTYEFKFYTDFARKERKDIHVFMHTDPTLLANQDLIRSTLSGLVSEHRYVMQIKKFTIQSEYGRSNPPIYLRVDHAGNSQASTAAVTGAFSRNGPLPGQGGGGPGGGGALGAINVLPNNAGGAIRPGNFGDRGQSSADILQNASTNMTDNLRFHNEQLKELSHVNDKNYYNLGLGFTPHWYNNMFICPPGMVLAANPHLPESRVDQLAIERHFNSMVYQTFGIPESMLGAITGNQTSIRGSSTRAANIRKDVNIMDVNTFESTLHSYQNFFKRCFAFLYEQIFKHRVDKDLVEFDPPQLYKDFIDTIIAGKVGEVLPASETKSSGGKPEEKEKEEKNENLGSNKEIKKKDTPGVPTSSSKAEEEPTNDKKRKRSDGDKSRESEEKEDAEKKRKPSPSKYNDSEKEKKSGEPAQKQPEKDKKTEKEDADKENKNKEPKKDADKEKKDTDKENKNKEPKKDTDKEKKNKEPKKDTDKEKKNKESEEEDKDEDEDKKKKKTKKKTKQTKKK